MIESGFYCVALDGSKVPTPYLDLHRVRRDILLYFDENVGEPISVLMPRHVFQQDYWAFLTIGYDKEWAESARYTRLIERGCLALINGITLDILESIQDGGTPSWSERGITVQDIIPYVERYAPSCPTLLEGRRRLLETLSFIDGISTDNFNEFGEIISFDWTATGKWFDEHIVQEYFRHMATQRT